MVTIQDKSLDDIIEARRKMVELIYAYQKGLTDKITVDTNMCANYLYSAFKIMTVNNVTDPTPKIEEPSIKPFSEKYATTYTKTQVLMEIRKRVAELQGTEINFPAQVIEEIFKLPNIQSIYQTENPDYLIDLDELIRWFRSIGITPDFNDGTLTLSAEVPTLEDYTRKYTYSPQKPTETKE